MPTRTDGKLKGKKVAILVADGFEQVELTAPKEALDSAGAETTVISPSSGKVRGWNHTDWGQEFTVDRSLDEADAEEFDAIVLPGGVMNPDTLRMDERATQFVRKFAEEGKPIAAICHGAWTLIDAGVVKDRQLTSYPSLKSDLENAGARWTDMEVVVDHGLVTSRGPKDMPAFIRKMKEEIAEGPHTSAIRL